MTTGFPPSKLFLVQHILVLDVIIRGYIRGHSINNGVNKMSHETKAHYEVSADWLKACGYGTGEAAQAFPVVRSYMAGHLPMVVVRLDNAREWEVIASWRGRYV
jgi:hypothetical protein